MATGTFATAIGCIDGRTTSATTDWLKQFLHVDYVDLITEAGPDKFLLHAEPGLIQAVRRKVLVSLTAHRSPVIAIAAHDDCAGNPVSESEHKAQIEECVNLIASWNLGVRVLGLWVNNSWQVELVYERDARPIDRVA